MPIDPYTSCPGGTGKKIKFCCGAELVGELDKIQRMLEGEQRAACLEHIESVEAKYPDRACLLSIKAMLEAQLGNEAGAVATLAKFVEKYPDNPVALSEKATLDASKEGGVAGVGLLQDALEKCTEQIPTAVYDAIGLVAQTLIADNEIIAARAHLMLQIGMAGSSDERPLQLFMRVNNSPSVPLLVKQDMPLLQAPDDALWKKGFTATMAPAMRGEWREAAGKLMELAAQVGDWPAIWHNIAALRLWLADTPAAVQALRKYASQSIPLDDAVEAESLAQSLDPETIDEVDVLTLTYEVRDTDVLLSRLAAHQRALRMPIDLARMGNAEEPPPKGAYWLMDQVMPASGKEIAIGEIPRVVGHVFVFGKQTDRPARMELAAYRPELDETKTAVSEVCGDAVGQVTAEEVVTRGSALQHALTIDWRMPVDTPPEKRQALVSQKRREILLERWPEVPQKIFGGRSASQAASDPQERIKVLAAILALELATEQVSSEFNFNDLRKKLGLPALEMIDPKSVSLPELPLARLARIDVKKLSNEELIELFRRADHFRHVAALRLLAHELVERPNLEKEIEKAEIYGVLAQTEPDTAQAIGYLEQARNAAEAAKTSTAPWDLAELALRIARGEVADADRLLMHIRNEHVREPGVAQALFQILAEAGIVGPDGKPTMPREREPSGIVVAGAAAAEPGKIWTPGADQPSGKKSALWTPGD